MGVTAESGLTKVGMGATRITLTAEQIAAFCQTHHIRKFALFGSVLREDFTLDSDIDVLVEFEAGHSPGLIRFAGMELELAELLGGRKVDLNTRLTLAASFRERVAASAEVLYVSGG